MASCSNSGRTGSVPVAVLYPATADHVLRYAPNSAKVQIARNWKSGASISSKGNGIVRYPSSTQRRLACQYGCRYVAGPGEPHRLYGAVVSGGRVYVGSGDGKLYVVDAASGKTVFEFEAGGPITASPAVADGKLVIGNTNGQLFAMQ